MPALNFQKQFREPIQEHSKIHTIRAKREDGRDPKPGQTLYLYIGMRTKSCEKLRETTCKRVRPIELTLTPSTFGASIDTVPLAHDDLESFSYAEGFESPEAMRAFFWKLYGGDHMPLENHDVLLLQDMLLIQWSGTVY